MKTQLLPPAGRREMDSIGLFPQRRRPPQRVPGPALCGVKHTGDDLQRSVPIRCFRGRRQTLVVYGLLTAFSPRETLGTCLKCIRPTASRQLLFLRLCKQMHETARYPPSLSSARDIAGRDGSRQMPEKDEARDRLREGCQDAWDRLQCVVERWAGGQAADGPIQQGAFRRAGGRV